MTEEHLLVQDRDSRVEALRVEVQRTARHGRLELHGQTLQQGDRFTLQDLRGLRLRSDTVVQGVWVPNWVLHPLIPPKMLCVGRFYTVLG